MKREGRNQVSCYYVSYLYIVLYVFVYRMGSNIPLNLCGERDGRTRQGERDLFGDSAKLLLLLEKQNVLNVYP